MKRIIGDSRQLSVDPWESPYCSSFASEPCMLLYISFSSKSFTVTAAKKSLVDLIITNINFFVLKITSYNLTKYINLKAFRKLRKEKQTKVEKSARQNCYL